MESWATQERSDQAVHRHAEFALLSNVAEAVAWPRSVATGSRGMVLGASLLAGVTAYTVAIFVVPSMAVSWQSADARILIEAFSFSVALFTALALHIATGDGADKTRNAFIAALLALSVSYAAMIVGLVLNASPSPRQEVIGLYAWLVPRYLAGLLFIAGTLGRPRWSVRRFATVIAAVMAAAVLVSGVLADILPAPLMRTVDGLAVFTFSDLGHTLITAVPAALFALGAVMAWQVHRHQPQPVYAWLALALALQSLSKVHELAYAATSGPVITSADVLRVGMLALLLAGAVTTMHRLAVDRVVAMKAQQGDLVAIEEVSASIARFAGQEQVFRSVVVHELATPIAAVRAFAHVLASPGQGWDPAAARDGIITASWRLQELVDRMEELRDIEGAGFTVELRPTDLAPLLNEVATFAQVLPGDHRVVVQCEGVRAHADPHRLGQALRNLITNATQYSPAGTTIVVSCHRVDDDRVRLAVTDSGPGIPVQDRTRLTAKFERGNHSGTVPGAGLGLYIVQQIAAAHGGRLVIDTAPGGTGTYAAIELQGLP